MNDKSRNQILVVLFLGVFMGALDIAIVAPALPAIQRAFLVNDRALTWTFTIYVLFNLIGTPLMAKLSDLLGRRSVYVLDVALFGLGSLIVALSSSSGFEVLFAGRAMQGFGAGGIFPVASAVIGDTFPPEKRGGALGLIGAVFGLAFLVGPILGGIIMTFASWQWLFVINIPIAGLVIAMGWSLLPARRPDARGSFDWAGMLSLGLLLGAFAYGLNQIDAANFFGSLSSLNVWPFLLAAIFLLGVFINIEKRAIDPVLHLTLFNNRQPVLASALAMGAGIGEVSLVFIPALAVVSMPTIVDKHTSSYLLMPVVLALAIGSPLVGRWLDKSGSKAVVTSGTILLALGALMLAFWNAVLWVFISAGVVIGLGLSALLGAPVRYIMLNEAPQSERTSAQGAIAIFGSIGQLISSALVGAIAASYGGGINGYSAAYLAIGVLSVVLVLLTLGLKNHQEELQHSESFKPVMAQGER
ncbi:MAG: MFS transporter [Anaerolineaceae bacterium]|nr:MFS transporter [Anaerolineaceae bacterium]